MTTFFRLLSTIGLLTAAPDQGKAVLERSIAAHGGLARFEAIRDWKIVARRETDSGGSETYEEYLLRDQGGTRTLLLKRQAESVLVFGHDGSRGFAVAEGTPRSDDGAEGEGYYRAHGEYYLRSLPFKWMDPGVEVAYAGAEDGFELLRVSASENVGRAWEDVWVAVIDRDTGLLFEARLTHHRGGETWMNRQRNEVTEITYRYSDYRDVDGLQIPFRMEYVSNGRKTGENVIQSIDFDTGLTAEIFSPRAHLR
ncbi:MAG TPA: hypothetical protein VEK15_26005 [Vicinamibacteria bacterium]|nr:hypothetical protein [Vicinamibacteria bacterium]